MTVTLRPEWREWLDSLPAQKRGKRTFTPEEQELIRLALPRTSLEALARRLQCSTRTLRSYLSAPSPAPSLPPVGLSSSSSPLPDPQDHPELNFSHGDEFGRGRI